MSDLEMHVHCVVYNIRDTLSRLGSAVPIILERHGSVLGNKLLYHLVSSLLTGVNGHSKDKNNELILFPCVKRQYWAAPLSHHDIAMATTLCYGVDPGVRNRLSGIEFL